MCVGVSCLSVQVQVRQAVQTLQRSTTLLTEHPAGHPHHRRPQL